MERGVWSYRMAALAKAFRTGNDSSQGQNLALTGLFVPNSLDSGLCYRMASLARPGARTRINCRAQTGIVTVQDCMYKSFSKTISA